MKSIYNDNKIIYIILGLSFLTFILLVILYFTNTKTKQKKLNPTPNPPTSQPTPNSSTSQPTPNPPTSQPTPNSPTITPCKEKDPSCCEWKHFECYANSNGPNTSQQQWSKGLDRNGNISGCTNHYTEIRNYTNSQYCQGNYYV